MDLYANMGSVRKFLDKFKTIALKNGIKFVNRKKNRHALVDLNISRKNRTKEILSLAIEDYCEGPQIDKDDSTVINVWIFGKVVKRKEVYIKIKIEKSVVAKCISFHEADYPLSYPYK